MGINQVKNKNKKVCRLHPNTNLIFINPMHSIICIQLTLFFKKMIYNS